MSTDICLANLARRDWLTDGPLSGFVTLYIDSLRDHRYSDRTIRGYLGGLAHFSYWIKNEDLELLILDASLIERFLLTHLAVCTCPAPSYCTAANSGAALRHLLRVLPLEQTASVVVDPIALELERFGDFFRTSAALHQTPETVVFNTSLLSSLRSLELANLTSLSFQRHIWISSLTN